MDLFDDEECRSAVLNYYQDSNEPIVIKHAILDSCKKAKSECVSKRYCCKSSWIKIKTKLASYI